MATSAYKKAGVDIQGADTWLKGMGRKVTATHSSAVMKDRGHFAGLFDLGKTKIKDPVLVSSTDGVGTKLKIAELTNKHSGLGIDLVAMNVNDIITTGAKPLFFLDYIAVGKLKPQVMSQVLQGVIDGCTESECSLLGGETAEMPGVYAPGSYDLAGFCVGAVERKNIIDGKKVKAKDAVIGIASSGVHSNGYSLVRHVFTDKELKKHQKSLLMPTRIYVKPVLKLLKKFSVHSLSHITGGGLTKRIPSLVQEKPKLKVELIEESWVVPTIFKHIQAAGSVSDTDMATTFNMGVGMALTLPQKEVAAAIRLLEREGFQAWQIGQVL